jgi:hypothetical protein
MFLINRNNISYFVLLVHTEKCNCILSFPLSLPYARSRSYLFNEMRKKRDVVQFLIDDQVIVFVARPKYSIIMTRWSDNESYFDPLTVFFQEYFDRIDSN